MIISGMGGWGIDEIDAIMHRLKASGVKDCRAISIKGMCPHCKKVIVTSADDPVCSCGWSYYIKLEGSTKRTLRAKEPCAEYFENPYMDDENEYQYWSRCSNCRNRYTVDLITENMEWHDSGFRYCPYCGQMFDATKEIIPVRDP